MVGCFATNCLHTSESHSCRYFRFPNRDKPEYKAWVLVSRRTDVTWPTTNNRLCSCHFKDGLKENGPSLFNLNEAKLLKPEKAKKRRRTDHSKSTPCRHDARRVSGSAHASHSSHTTSTSKQHGHAENSKTLRKCLGFHGWKDVCYMEPLVKEITGVSMATFYLLLEHLSLETHPVRGSGLSAENSLLVFLMKLKLNTPFKHLAAQFSVAPSTLEQVFLLILTTISDLTSDLIQWPQKSVIQSTMPSFIKRSFPNCRLILDCLEIETDAPSHLFTQLRMISRSDSSFKAKALIGLTPNGYICFISQLFGGSISYPQLSEENSLKNLLDSGDEVLSLKPDRHLSSIHGIRVHNQPIWPQFSKHSSRFRDDADSLNRHFDKLQQQLRTFSILRSKVSLNLLQYLDSVLQVCAVLSNLEAMPSGDA
ncbi:uncharacterized protein LOC119745688 isoform X2 [Patiria miniata]|uniref:THAP-type domain-containing protein n=1 Tax=Patiria miniata TaxID=46514 RepID=A0A914BPT6_PATMI|nr:uncharacterized protein LOC119745688 isoform X2 [Patiria miniata]